jgi:sensitive to high expression protein 9, mitochondrial
MQREVNDLLQRKSQWSESDVSRFTELVRRDHVNEQEEKDTKTRLEEEELKVEKGLSGEFL